MQRWGGVRAKEMGVQLANLRFVPVTTPFSWETRLTELNPMQPFGRDAFLSIIYF